MYTQSTPVHVNLWHKDFWLLALCNMLLSFSVYVFIPVMPLWCRGIAAAGDSWAAVLMAAYCVGLFLPGPFTSYVVERWRRDVVCMLSILLMAACMGGMFYLSNASVELDTNVVFCVSVSLRLVFGAMFGLAHSVLASTIIIDKCESFLRTEANHATAWFFRFSLSLGPLVGIIVGALWGTDTVLAVSAACCVVAVVLIRMVDIPFKAPDENVRAVSLDRFFLPRGVRLFSNQFVLMAAVGVLLGIGHTAFFYGAMMGGFFMALLAQRFVFVNAELRSEILTGLLLTGCAVLMLLCRDGNISGLVPPVLTGLGVGITGSRFLLFFLKLGNHCQRGTSQNTFFLSWESGLGTGLAVGYFMGGDGDADVRLYVSLALIVVAFVMYQFSTHTWYIAHKNR